MCFVRNTSLSTNSWMDAMMKWSKNAPLFALNANQIETIETPNQFYSKLKSLTTLSTKRVIISSLYIGTDHLENDLINCLTQTQKLHQNLRINILLDYNRSTRVNENELSSKSLLMPLIANGAKVSFYLTSNMSGWRKYLVFNRQKWNELVSLHHIKCYVFDDNVIISGANLSDQYFTNRQDRYILFKNCGQLCDYFDELISGISKFSLQLKQDGQFVLDDNNRYDPLKYFHSNQFNREAKRTINQLNDKFRNCGRIGNSDTNTYVFPLLQIKSLGIDNDERFTQCLLEYSQNSLFTKLASGYFNLTKRYKDILLNNKYENRCDILMASERANGFYGAKGAVGYIPFVYTYLAKTFLKQVYYNHSNIALHAYNRPNWTFHAKGLWVALDCNHFLTTIGSPNFGYRSVHRDSELQLVLITSDQQLKRELLSECDYLWQYSAMISDVNQMESVPLWVRIFALLFKSYF